MPANHVKQKIPIHQKMVGDAVRLGNKTPYIHTLVELEATHARNLLRKYRRVHSQSVSFSTYVMACCIKAIKQDTRIQRTFTGNNSSVDYDVVDVFYPTELDRQTPKVVSALIKNAENLSLIDLQQQVNNVDERIDGNRRLFMKLPWFVRNLFYTLWLAIPKTRKAYFGTVYFSSILNFSGDRRAWGVPIPMHGFGIFVGTMCDRLIQTTNGVENKSMVQITLSVDHGVNNGADMARFVHRLKHILEFDDLTQD